METVHGKEHTQWGRPDYTKWRVHIYSEFTNTVDIVIIQCILKSRIDPKQTILRQFDLLRVHKTVPKNTKLPLAMHIGGRILDIT